MREKIKEFSKGILRIIKMNNPMVTPIVLSKIDRLADDEIKNLDNLIKNFK